MRGRARQPRCEGQLRGRRHSGRQRIRRAAEPRNALHQFTCHPRNHTFVSERTQEHKTAIQSSTRTELLGVGVAFGQLQLCAALAARQHAPALHGAHGVVHGVGAAALVQRGRTRAERRVRTLLDTQSARPPLQDRQTDEDST